MRAITRTIRHWRTTVERLPTGPTSATITAAGRRDGFVHHDDLLTIQLAADHAREMDDRAPMTSWWMPATPDAVTISAEATATAEAADVFLRTRRQQSRTPDAVTDQAPALDRTVGAGRVWLTRGCGRR